MEELQEQFIGILMGLIILYPNVKIAKYTSIILIKIRNLKKLNNTTKGVDSNERK